MLEQLVFCLGRCFINYLFILPVDGGCMTYNACDVCCIVHCSSLCCIVLHCVALCCIVLHCVALCCIVLLL